MEGLVGGAQGLYLMVFLEKSNYSNYYPANNGASEKPAVPFTHQFSLRREPLSVRCGRFRASLVSEVALAIGCSS